MSARNRRRRTERRARPAAAVMAERAVVRQPPVLVSTYAEPTAERVTDTFEAYSRLAFLGNGVVFGSINFRMKLFGEARLCWRNLDDKSLTYKPGGELARFVKPWPNGTTGDLLTRMEQDASLAGNAYVRDCGNRLERLRPDWVTIVSWVTEDDRGHEVREVIGYMYDPTGDPDRKPDWYPVEEVAHWAPTPDPLANWRGVSWLTPVIREINADKAMVEHQDKFYRNAATPNIIIKYSGKMTGGQKIGLAESIAARHGGPDKAGGTLVLDEGADPMIVGSKLSDSQFTDALAANENRIAVASGVPAMVIGLKEGLQAAAWSMYRQACRAVVDTTLRPNWRGACAALSTLVDVPDGFELWFDTRDIAALQEGETEIAATMQVNAATATSFISGGFEPDSVIKAIVAGDMTLLKHTGLVSVQLLPPGTDPAAAKPDEGGDAAERADLERAFDPNQRRDSKGRWTKGGGGVSAALKSGADDALDGFGRETLRREAKKRGITLPRGASLDEIRDALHDHHADESGSKKPAERVREAYDDLAKQPGDWVSLTDLRKGMDDMSRPEQDKAMRDMAVSLNATFVPEDNQKTLTAEDRAAALHVGGEDKHLIQIEKTPDTPPAKAKAPIAKSRPEPKPAKAMTPEAALAAAPKDVEASTGPRKIDKAGAAALERYRGKDFTEINGDLRGGKQSAKTKATVEQIDRVHAESRLTEDVVLHRGIGDIDRVFGAASKKKLTGAEWQDDAFQSTTADPDVADRFTVGEQGRRGAAVMKIRVPKGAGAIQLSDGNYEAEMLLQRGLRMRVISDSGPWRRGQKGPRTIEVEVVPV